MEEMWSPTQSPARMTYLPKLFPQTFETNETTRNLFSSLPFIPPPDLSGFTPSLPKTLNPKLPTPNPKLPTPFAIFNPMFFRRPHQLKALGDEELVQLYQKEEDPLLVGELFERYTDLAFLVCMKYMKEEEAAKDVVMQVFEKLINDLKRYEVRNFKYWLHTVVKNQCLAELDRLQRARQKHETYHATEGPDVESAASITLPGEVDEEEWEMDQLGNAIALLKEEQKTCIELFYLKNKSYKEVAEITGYTMMQVKSHIQNGKRNLKKHLIEMGIRRDP
jgi:RNA polymerase sigma factor (sigma-70 family)